MSKAMPESPTVSSDEEPTNVPMEQEPEEKQAMKSSMKSRLEFHKAKVARRLAEKKRKQQEEKERKAKKPSNPKKKGGKRKNKKTQKEGVVEVEGKIAKEKDDKKKKKKKNKKEEEEKKAETLSKNNDNTPDEVSMKDDEPEEKNEKEATPSTPTKRKREEEENTAPEPKKAKTAPLTKEKDFDPAEKEEEGEEEKNKKKTKAPRTYTKQEIEAKKLEAKRRRKAHLAKLKEEEEKLRAQEAEESKFMKFEADIKRPKFSTSIASKAEPYPSHLKTTLERDVELDANLRATFKSLRSDERVQWVAYFHSVDGLKGLWESMQSPNVDGQLLCMPLQPRVEGFSMEECLPMMELAETYDVLPNTCALALVHGCISKNVRLGILPATFVFVNDKYANPTDCMCAVGVDNWGRIMQNVGDNFSLAVMKYAGEPKLVLKAAMQDRDAPVTLTYKIPELEMEDELKDATWWPSFHERFQELSFVRVDQEFLNIMFKKYRKRSRKFKKNAKEEEEGADSVGGGSSPGDAASDVVAVRLHVSEDNATGAGLSFQLGPTDGATASNRTTAVVPLFPWRNSSVDQIAMNTKVGPRLSMTMTIPGGKQNGGESKNQKMVKQSGLGALAVGEEGDEIRNKSGGDQGDGSGVFKQFPKTAAEYFFRVSEAMDTLFRSHKHRQGLEPTVLLIPTSLMHDFFESDEKVREEMSTLVMQRNQEPSRSFMLLRTIPLVDLSEEERQNFPPIEESDDATLMTKFSKLCEHE